MASLKRLLALTAVASIASAADLARRQELTTSGYTPYYPALATGYTTDPASAATSTTTANQPCVTQPEAGTYCGFINPLDPPSILFQPLNKPLRLSKEYIPSSNKKKQIPRQGLNIRQSRMQIRAMHIPRPIRSRIRIE